MTKSVYLLPGTMCDHRLWSYMEAHLNKRFPARYQCHYLSIARSGDIDELLMDIKRQLPDEKVTLMGFSLGGYLATEFTVKYPEHLEQLLVVSNQPTVLPEQEIKERTRTVDWIKRNGYTGIPKKRILGFLDKTAQRNQAIIELIQAMDKDLGGDVLVHQIMATTQRRDLFNALTEQAINTHFCVGENDHLVDVSKLKSWTASNRQSSLSVFDNTGHMLPLEQGGRLAQWLTEKL